MRGSRHLLAARARVPASTSNLGAGFDCLGLALDRYLRLAFEPGPEPLRLERGGTLASVGHPTDADLLIRVFRARLEELGITGPTGTLVAESEIPIARGLGSSAAAVVAALAVADAAAGRAAGGAGDSGVTSVTGGIGSTGADPRLPRPLLREARRWEGHLDNVGPCVLGGLVAVAHGGNDEPALIPLPLSDRVGFAYAAPGLAVRTADARAALPETVPHARAAAALGRVAALVQGLGTGDPDLLRIGFQDDLHTPYRLPLIPRAGDAMSAGLKAGAWAATISGSGSGLIAVCPRGDEAAVADAMAGAFAARPDDVVIAMALLADRAGLLSGELVPWS